jgi:transcriptional regulator with XRE-family HTH domain
MELKIARRIARLSKQELALRAGLDLDTIVRLESGSGRELVGDLAYRSVVHLAQALGVPPTDLFPIAPLLPPLPRLTPDAVPTPFDPNEERDDA